MLGLLAGLLKMLSEYPSKSVGYVGYYSWPGSLAMLFMLAGYTVCGTGNVGWICRLCSRALLSEFAGWL
jgi:hypothetical protein